MSIVWLVRHVKKVDDLFNEMVVQEALEMALAVNLLLGVCVLMKILNYEK